MNTGSRRRFLFGAAAACGAVLSPAHAASSWLRTENPRLAHAGFGRVQPPVPAPALGLTTELGTRATLAELLRGKRTAIQYMFTGCSATCPMQGALFAAVQAKLGPTEPIQLLSISVDSLGDSPEALKRWLGRFGAQPGRWGAGVADARDADQVLALADWRSGRANDNHGTRIYVTDANAALIGISDELPSSTAVLGLLRMRA